MTTRVLVVDDEAGLATAICDGLRDAGFAADWAADGEQALAQVARERYGLVVCDLRMPRVDGPALYRAIAASSPTLARRVIFVTGDALDADAELFLATCGCRWLSKPFRLGELVRLARDVVG